MKETTEFKLVPQFVKGIDGRTVDGIFSVFDVLDEYDDIAHKGSFTKTISERGDEVLHLWQHDFYSPPTAKIDKLMEIERAELPELIRAKYPEASGGAMVRRTYIESARADEVFAAIKAGSPLQMSYGYDAIRYEFEEDEETGKVIRHLREQRLWETSDVLWGANQATQASKILRPSIPLETLLGQLDKWLTNVKEGRRNADKDMQRINKIATLAIELGATAVVLAPADNESDEGKALEEIAEAAIEQAANEAERKQREADEAGKQSPVIRIVVAPGNEERLAEKLNEALADAIAEAMKAGISRPIIIEPAETTVDEEEEVDNKSAELEEEDAEADLIDDGEEDDQRRAVEEKDLTLTLIGNRLDLFMLEAG